MIDNPALLISEEAQDLIGYHLRQYRADRRALAAFCLVTRYWLSSARRALYHDPLALVQSLGFGPPPIKLVTTLETWPHLGELVRCVHPREVTSNFGKARDSLEFYIRMLKVCPKPRRLSLPFPASRDAIEIIEAAPRPLELEVLTLYSTQPKWFDVFAYARGMNILEQSFQHSSAFGLYIDGVVEAPLFTSQTDAQPRIPFKLTSLSLYECGVFPSLIPFLLPKSSASLREVHLSLAGTPSRATARFVKQTIGSNLEVLKHFADTLWIEGGTFSVEEYDSITAVAIPSELYTPLPSLRHVGLEDIHGITLSDFEALIKGSPLLASINFRDSVWDFAPSVPFGLATGSPAIDFLLVDEILRDLLARLPRTVERVHLGVLPTSNKTIPKFSKVADDRGFLFNYQRCPNWKEEDEEI